MTEICEEFCLYSRSLKTMLRNTAGVFLLTRWKQVEKENVGTVDETTLPEVLRIQAEGFENQRQGDLIKHSKKFREIFYTIKSRDSVIGYCTYYLKPSFSLRGFEKESVIYSVAIDRKFRNKGFGRKLMEESILEMKHNGVQSIFLYVNVNNTPAMKLYKKTGFLIIKEVKNICGQKERCYKMKLKLY
ncbi:GCN5-related N-acetyltransferase [Methanosarcina horonobensis HB-1 = JCM 15518]|uniref:GCN5-related N-acetyltransferase n=1 Tax=Methanosarcina horonobensis HB-1 = JCM 15518 TaxID=1434110 RepID=A0A0E3SHD2_9EURY|nr:GCN5-related N-acetyltransferase [Methanosarcina horonobensis HB-1 = JCM 15518]